MLKAKYYLLLIATNFMSLGCMSTDSNGVKRHNAVSRLNPFNWGAADPVPMTDKQFVTAQIAAQLAKFQWAALGLIVGGAFVWYWTKGATGFGKFMVGLGVALSLYAIVIQKYAALIGFVAIIGVVVLVIYVIWQYFQKDEPTSEITQ